MPIYTKQEVSNVHMHVDGRDTEFEVRHVAGSTDVLQVRMTDWQSHIGHQFELFASDEQLKDLEHALHVYNLERTMEKDEGSHVHINRAEKVTA
jgi:hypothetical protein